MDIGEVPARLRSLPSFAITLTAARASQLVGERVSALGVSKATYGMLAAIEEFGPLSQADLGRRFGMDRKSISDEAVRLDHAGFVRRGPDPADPRRNLLEITAAGRALLAQLESSFTDVQDQLLVALSPEERTELARLLQLIAGPAPAPSGQT